MLVVKFHYWDILGYAIKDRIPPPAEIPPSPEGDGEKKPKVKPKLVGRAPTKAEAEAKVEELKKERPEADLFIEEESGRQVIRTISEIAQVIQHPAPNQAKALPEDGVDPLPPPFVGAVLLMPPPPDKPDSQPFVELPARKTEEEMRHPRFIEVFNEAAKLMYRYDL